MTSSEAISSGRPQLGRTVVPLLALVVLINYVDRGNLATAAPLIKGEMHLTNSQFGMLVSAFFWTYVPSHLLVGWLIDRINAYRTLALGLALWGLATALSGLASGFAWLLCLRLLLGVGESAAFPCSSKLLAQHLPADKLGAANGWVTTGLALGPAIGVFFGARLMAQLGWRSVFILFGLVSLAWLWPWLTSTKRNSAAASEHIEDPAPTIWAILRRSQWWGAAVGQFCGNYAVYFVLTWLPLYLVKARGFSMSQMGDVGAIVYLIYAAFCVIGGRGCDYLILRGWSVTRVRKSAIVGAHVAMAAALMLCSVASGPQCIACLMVAGAAFGVNASTLYPIGQTLSGARAGGKWIGLQNAFANIAGIVGPMITGAVVDWTGQFYWAFIIAGGVALGGLVGWGVMIRKVEPLAWAP